MADQQTVQGPDGNQYQFPAGTTKDQAIAYFKKKGVGVKSSPAQQPWQKSLESGVERFMTSAGVPPSPSDIPKAAVGMLMPQGDPQHPTVGEKIPILGPILTAQQQTLDQPGAWAKIFGSIPLIGPPAYEGSKALERGDYWSAAGSVANIA